MSAMSATCTPVVFSVNTTRIQRANDPYSGFKPNVISIHDESNDKTAASCLCRGRRKNPAQLDQTLPRTTLAHGNAKGQGCTSSQCGQVDSRPLLH